MKRWDERTLGRILFGWFPNSWQLPHYDFAELSTKLTDCPFFFTGTGLNLIRSAEHISGLLKHPWQSRQKETHGQVDDVQTADEDGKKSS